ncbi:DoxX family membrane protein [Burkholderia sp. BCC1977]|uniref:DoxX family membrane protein n=1 Tax=Burkholderia sp. BCC1977 TaxID=2817440 RepID=UPI002ABD2CBC|nr:DoxX family membrane protein [Burkholderia sp. BCC1977]
MSHTVDLIAGYGLPFQALVAVVAIGVEIGLGLLLMLGCRTRRLAVLLRCTRSRPRWPAIATGR